MSISKFQSLLKELEETTGEFYQITINRFGETSDKNIVLGAYNERTNKVKVYDMEPCYKSLEGIYENQQELKKRLVLSVLDEEFSDITEREDGKLSGKCVYCKDEINDISNQHYCDCDLSRGRDGRAKDTNYPLLYICNGDIYTRGGNIMNIHGHYKFINIYSGCPGDNCKATNEYTRPSDVHFSINENF